MTAATDTFVSVVAPLRDDGDILEAFVNETVAVLEEHFANYELVLVDDGSRDHTRACVDQLLKRFKCIRYIRLSRRFGIEAAIVAGLDGVIGDYVAVLQPDTDPPALLPEMVSRARRSGGVVFGVPKRRPGEPLWSRVGRALFHALGSRLLGVQIPSGASQFQVLSRNAVNGVTRMRDKQRHLRLLSLDVSYATELFPYRVARRRSRPRVRGPLESLALAISIVVSNSTRPLRIVSAAGLLMSAVNLACVGYVFVVSLLGADVGAGWTTSELQSGVMFFLLFLILAVLSEYVGRIVAESRERPLYHVIEERASNVQVADAERRNVVSSSTSEPAIPR